MFSCFAPKIVDMTRFKRTYDDANLLFFRTIFIEAKETLHNALPVLEECIEKKNVEKWNQTIMAIKSIAKDLFFSRLTALKINKKPNLIDYQRIKERIEALLEFKYNF
jgi:hypothetical protein